MCLRPPRERSDTFATVEPTLRDLADKIDDVSRLVARQSATLAAVVDTKAATGPDLPLLVELHALHTDAHRCAATARSRRERAAFDALVAGMERLLAGRGGAVVAPAPGEAFSGATMEAVEVVTTTEPDRDRTVAVLLEPGLQAGDRNVRPARVAVHRLGRPARTALPSDSARRE